MTDIAYLRMGAFHRVGQDLFSVKFVCVQDFISGGTLFCVMVFRSDFYCSGYVFGIVRPGGRLFSE